MHISTISNNLQILTRKEEELEDEVNKLKKKLDGHKGDGDGRHLDRYLEKTVFIEFQSSYNKEIENIYRKIDELRRWIEEILEALKKFATKDELKALEGMFLLQFLKLLGHI